MDIHPDSPRDLVECSTASPESGIKELVEATVRLKRFGSVVDTTSASTRSGLLAAGRAG
jgi:hypothetical protein